MEKLNYYLTKRMWVLFLFFQMSFIYQSTLAEQNIRIFDGDSFLINHKEWRLWGIDAPELHQKCKLKNTKSGADELIACGEMSKKKLISLMLKPIDCELKDIDRYKRNVGFCKNAKGVIINREMVLSGFAFDYRRYSNFYFEKEEQLAKKNQVGLWQYRFIWPWHWRKKNRRK